MAEKPLFATRDFRDAGTEKLFAAGDDVSAEAGADNYAAAGLASDEQPVLNAAPLPAPVA